MKEKNPRYLLIFGFPVLMMIFAFGNCGIFEDSIEVEYVQPYDNVTYISFERDIDPDDETDRITRYVSRYEIKSGELLWRTKLPITEHNMFEFATGSGMCHFSDGYLYYASYNHDLEHGELENLVVSIELSSGEIQWVVSLPDPEDFAPGRTPFLHYGDLLIRFSTIEDPEGQDDTQLLAISKENGSILWELTLDDYSWNFPLEHENKLILSSFYEESHPSFSRSAIIDLRTGEYELLEDVGKPGIIVDGQYYYVDVNNKIDEYNLSTGAQHIYGDVPVSEIMLFDDTKILYHDQDRDIVIAKSLTDGKTLWELKVPGISHWYDILLGESSLYPLEMSFGQYLHGNYLVLVCDEETAEASNNSYKWLSLINHETGALEGITDPVLMDDHDTFPGDAFYNDDEYFLIYGDGEILLTLNAQTGQIEHAFRINSEHDFALQSDNAESGFFKFYNNGRNYMRDSKLYFFENYIYYVDDGKVTIFNLLEGEIYGHNSGLYEITDLVDQFSFS